MTSISIVVPVFNVEPWLRRCLDSLLAQTFPDWEVICVDDGSTDGSSAILDEYAGRDGRIRVVRQENRGTHVARKVGVFAAASEWCFFLDPDDWLEDDALSRLLPVLSENGTDIVGVAFFVHAEEERLRSTVDLLERQFALPCQSYSRDEFFEAAFVSRKVSAHLIGKAVRGEVCRRAFGSMADRRFVFQEDICAFYRIIAESASARSMSDRLYHYRVGPGISYRPYMRPEEFFGSFTKFDELDDIKAFCMARFPADSAAVRALEKLEVRLALASVSEALGRLESKSDGREGVRRLRDVCSDEVLSAACAEWFRLKGEKLADAARSYGLGDILGDVALRQLDYVWRGHNAKLRCLEKEIDGLRHEVAALRKRLDHPWKNLLGEGK